MKILKKEMKLKGYSNTKLANELDITQGAVSLWLSGDSKPSLENIEKLRNLGFSDTAALAPDKEVEP